MKTSERKQNKFKAIKKRKKIIKLDKNIIRLSYPKRHENDTLARYVFLETVEKLHRDLFALRAMEKQIKIPVKVTVIRSEVVKNCDEDGKQETIFSRFAAYYCQVCGEFLTTNLLGGPVRNNYCPRCGQKLWWSKN